MNWHSIQIVKLLAAVADDGDEICIFELLEMLRHRLPSHVHMTAQRRQRLPVLLVKKIEQTSTGGIRQRFEDFVDVHESVVF